jgi:hypothetical protein
MLLLEQMLFMHMLLEQMLLGYMCFFKLSWVASLGSFSIFHLFTITLPLNKNGSVKLEHNWAWTFCLETFSSNQQPI